MGSYSRSEHILHDVLVLHGGGPVLLGGGGGGLAPSAPVPLVLGAGGGGGALGLVALLAEQRHLGIIYFFLLSWMYMWDHCRGGSKSLGSG